MLKKKKKRMFDNPSLKCSFDLPDPLRLRHVENYECARDTAKLAGASTGFSINWVGALELIENWACPSIKEPKNLVAKELGDVHGDALRVIIWVAGIVNRYVLEQLIVPKN